MKLLIISIISLYLVSGCLEQTRNETVINDSEVPEYSPVVDLAKKDLSVRLNILPEEIILVKEESVEWPDTSLGYPEEGMMYAQVITPGFKIILKAQDKLYEYHSDYERVAGPRQI